MSGSYKQTMLNDVPPAPTVNVKYKSAINRLCNKVASIRGKQGVKFSNGADAINYISIEFYGCGHG